MLLTRRALLIGAIHTVAALAVALPATASEIMVVESPAEFPSFLGLPVAEIGPDPVAVVVGALPATEPLVAKGDPMLAPVRYPGDCPYTLVLDDEPTIFDSDWSYERVRERIDAAIASWPTLPPGQTVVLGG